MSIAIMQDENGYPSKLRAPNGCHVPPPKILYESIPFAEGKDLIVDVPVDTRGTEDVYIDDTIDLTVDVENSNNIQRIEQTTLLDIHCASRDKHVNEPITREEIAARAKLIAEAGADEVKKSWVGFAIEEPSL